MGWERSFTEREREREFKMKGVLFERNEKKGQDRSWELRPTERKKTRAAFFFSGSFSGVAFREWVLHACCFVCCPVDIASGNGSLLAHVRSKGIPSMEKQNTAR